ncbi:MAG: PASTA domain-containing protein [Bacteroidales bacterium]|nr:PASTA domain-containing protein [Bacteroidales bacterium]
MNIIHFLINKKFLIHLGISILLIIVLIWIVMKFLDIYTRHGESIIVPDYTGLTISEIDSVEFNHQFEFIIIDSVYDSQKKGGSVVMQDPLPRSKVKRNRKIYVSLVAILPEQVPMPNLLDLSLRQAINELESGKLKTGKLIYKPSFDKNAVLEQLFKGDTILPGTIIEKGSVIDLILGNGLITDKIKVPFLIGKNQKEAINTVKISSFNIGEEFFLDSNDLVHSRVYMQNPSFDSKEYFSPGDTINLWYRSDEHFDFMKLLISLKPDTLITDTLTDIY